MQVIGVSRLAYLHALPCRRLLLVPVLAKKGLEVLALEARAKEGG